MMEPCKGSFLSVRFGESEVLGRMSKYFSLSGTYFDKNDVNLDAIYKAARKCLDGYPEIRDDSEEALIGFALAHKSVRNMFTEPRPSSTSTVPYCPNRVVISASGPYRDASEVESFASGLATLLGLTEVKRSEGQFTSIEYREKTE